MQSALCYYHAAELLKARPNVPVGMIDASWGATYIEPWVRLVPA
jgi:hypothetical protein